MITNQNTNIVLTLKNNVCIVPNYFISKGGVHMDRIVKIEIITRQNKFESLKEALNKINVSGMTVTQVLGYGNQKGRTEVYRGTEYSVDLLPKIKIEVVVPENLIDPIVSVTTQICNTGNIGDGKIFIYPIERVIRIRTQEEASNAI